MEEANIVKWICVVICVAIVSGVGSCQATRYQIRAMVEAGAKPLDAACAYEVGTGDRTSPACAINSSK